MRQKIVLRQQAVPLNVTLPNGTSFALRYERISKRNLPGNIRVTKTWTIGLQKRCTRKKKVRLALPNKPTQDRAKRIKKKYSRLWHAQTGCGLVGNLTKLGLNIGSKAINSAFEKKLIDEGISCVRNSLDLFLISIRWKVTLNENVGFMDAFMLKPCIRNPESGWLQINHKSEKWQWRQNLLTQHHH